MPTSSPLIEDDGYRRSAFWLADGWNLVQQAGWQAPLYWQRRDGGWWEMTLAGLRELDRQAPVCHISFYEAEAYAAWAGARLPSEAEWEVAALEQPLNGNFVESGYLQPLAGAPGLDAPAQLFGDVWEWTGSAYRPYPGFRALEGSLGEYNGKFMCGQMVLRGGCCATPQAHIRASYRNFFAVLALLMKVNGRCHAQASLARRRPANCQRIAGAPTPRCAKRPWPASPTIPSGPPPSSSMTGAAPSSSSRFASSPSITRPVPKS